MPFNTNDGYGIESSFDTVRELCPNSIILEGFSMKGGVDKDGQANLNKDEKKKEAETNVKQWLQRLKLLNETSEKIVVQ